MRTYESLRARVIEIARTQRDPAHAIDHRALEFDRLARVLEHERDEEILPPRPADGRSLPDHAVMWCVLDGKGQR